MITKLVILDRDGTINHDSDEYVKTAQEWTPMPGALEAIARERHWLGEPALHVVQRIDVAPTFPNGCHVAEVEIDPETGTIDLLSYTAVDDYDTRNYILPFLTDADVFAARACDAIAAGRSFVVIPWQMAWVARLLRVLPNAVLDRALAGRGRKKRRGED